MAEVQALRLKSAELKAKISELADALAAVIELLSSRAECVRASVAVLILPRSNDAVLHELDAQRVELRTRREQIRLRSPTLSQARS